MRYENRELIKNMIPYAEGTRTGKVRRIRVVEPPKMPVPPSDVKKYS